MEAIIIGPVILSARIASPGRDGQYRKGGGKAHSVSAIAGQAPIQNSLLHPIAVLKSTANQLWQQFFSHPMKWCDHRCHKTNAKYTGSKRKKIGAALWKEGRSTPQLFRSKLATLPPGEVQQNPSSCTKLIAEFVKVGQHMKALELFEAMLSEGLIPHKFDVVSILKACASLAAFNKGRRVHEWIVASGLGSDVYIGNGLIDMYMKCGCTEEACRVFNEMLHHDIVSWSAMIMGYALCGEAEKALELFDKMRQENVKPNRVTFLGALKACSGIESLRDGRVVHEQILRSECGSDVIVGNCLISMYSKCCSIEDACRVFNSLSTEDVVSWSALILGYLKCGQGEKALQLFAQMHREQVQANRVTFTGVINACASIASLEDGRHAHAQVIKQALNSDTLVGNSLIDMYTKCGSLDGACRVFNNMQMRTVVSWNTMIMCFVWYGQANKVLQLYKQMQLESIETSTFTFVGVLNACANAGALEEGKLIHANIIRCRFHLDITVSNCLIDMYSKCGSIEDACRVFNNMGKRDLVSWNSMLGGFSMSGLAKETLRLLGHIPRDGLEIDSTTVVCILSACSRAGFVDEGLHYFEVIGPLYGNLATVEHYSCMVDLLARSGHLHEAEHILERMPYQPDVCMWLSLLGACRIYGEVEIGEEAANHILELEPSNASGYVLLSNIYAAARG